MPRVGPAPEIRSLKTRALFLKVLARTTGKTAGQKRARKG